LSTGRGHLRTRKIGPLKNRYGKYSFSNIGRRLYILIIIKKEIIEIYEFKE